MPLREQPTTPFDDQKPGTAGLRKTVARASQPHYLENFVQAVLDNVPELAGGRLVVGGDGRYYNDHAIQTILAMAVAHGVQHVLVGREGWLSTPAASHLIRAREADGGLVLTASHNPAGPDGDFGIKLNVAGGGQAPQALTDAIFESTRRLERYRICDMPPVDLSRLHSEEREGCLIEVIDPVTDYATLMQQLFDFDRIRDWLGSHRVLFDAMHAITGPYARRILVEQLGAPESAIRNATPLPDFGGGHPDPNLVYAADLVAEMMAERAPADLAAASDGDGDRNMILGRGLFVSPGDSLAMLAAHLHRLPGYADGLAGVARSMPTSRAVDAVARDLGIDCYETPTGWKFFANLLDAGRITLCGEESFGTSSHHTREKDGLWATLAWMNVLAATGEDVASLAARHWQRFGRHHFQRQDYEGLDDTTADGIMNALRSRLPELAGSRHDGLTVSAADDFAYLDPVDGSQATGQGLRVVFGERARIVLRRSGTGTGGATLRLYLEAWSEDAGDGATRLAALNAVAETLTRLRAESGRDKPDVVT